MSDAESQPPGDGDGTPTPSQAIADLVGARDEAKALLKAIKGRAKSTEDAFDVVQQLHSAIDGDAKAIAADAQAARELLTQIEKFGAVAKQTDATLAGLHTAAAAAAQNAVEAQEQAASHLEAIAVSEQSASSLAKELQALRARAEEAASLVATKSEHIEQGRLHADTVRETLDAAVAKAAQAETTTDAALESIKSKTNEMATLLATAVGTKASIDTIGEAVAAVRKDSEAHMNATKRIAEIADTVEAKVKTYETHLEELQKSATDRLVSIEALLHGATSAGLAHAFDRRGSTFRRPANVWQGTFIAALVGLLLLAVFEAYNGGNAIPEYSELGRKLLNRLPFLIPLVWLAIHAARQASLAKRMEEEYAFKATISASFEGYRRELAAIEDGIAEGSPLATLCHATLRTISTPPGQIYDRNRMDPTPGTAAADFVAPVVDGVSKALAPVVDGVSKALAGNLPVRKP